MLTKLKVRAHGTFLLYSQRGYLLPIYMYTKRTLTSDEYDNTSLLTKREVKMA